MQPNNIYQPLALVSSTFTESIIAQRSSAPLDNDRLESFRFHRSNNKVEHTC